MHEHDTDNLTLTPADAAALDALVESRALGPRLADDRPLPQVDPQATNRVAAAMRLIDAAPVEAPSADLVKKTMHRVIAARSIDLDIVRMQATRRGPAFPVRLSEMITVAAMVLIGIGLAIPVLNRTREEAMRVACESNLGTAGKAFYQYARNNVGAMPHGLIEPNSLWFYTGQNTSVDEPVRSNSANLYRIARGRYVDPTTLACPSYEHAAQNMTPDMLDWANSKSVSYSYHNQFGERTVRLIRAPRMAILADRNPMFAIQNGGNPRLLYLKGKPGVSPSVNHTAYGQNVLYADGSVWWATHPIMGNGTHKGDNIWLADGVEDYDGDETPSRDDDAFLVP